MGTDVKIRSGVINADTAGGGTQDFTISGFGTPKAALFIVTSGTVVGTRADHIRLSIGACDADAEWVGGYYNEDNLGTTESQCFCDQASCIKISGLAATTIDGEASFNSFITDGVRINWDNYPGAAYEVLFTLFGGADLQVDVGNTSSGADVACGFEPDQVIFSFATGTTTSDGVNGGSGWIGLADNTGTGAGNQVCTFWGNSYGQDFADGAGGVFATGGTPRVAILSNLGTDISRAQSVNGYYAGPTPAAGIDMTYHAGSSSSAIYSGYLALEYGGTLKHSVEMLDTPISASTNTVSATLGGTPQFVMATGSLIETEGSYIGSGATTEGWMIGLWDEDDKWCATWTLDDGPTTSNTASYITNDWADIDDPSGSDLVKTTSVTFDANGFTIDWATIPGTAKKWGFLCVEAPPAAGTSSSSLRLPLLGVG